MKNTCFNGKMKTALLVCAVVLSAMSLQAQEARTLFLQMPDSLLPLLTDVNKADCIDFLDSKMKAKVENRFGRQSEMTVLEKDYICLQLSSQTTWQMKVLAVNDSTQVIAVAETVCAPVCDSSVKFYTSDWKTELPVTDFLDLPAAMDEFIVRPETPDKEQEFEKAFRNADRMLLAKYDFSAGSTDLAVTLTTPELMDKETAEKLNPYLRRTMVYRWENGRFNRSAE